MFDESNINDLRRATVVDRDDDKVGNVGQVYLDDVSGRPSWVTVNTGLFGTNETFIPLDEATVDGDKLRVPYEKSFIKDAPNHDADGHLDASQEEELYRYYGLSTGQAAAGTAGDPHATDSGRAAAGQNLSQGDRNVADRNVADRNVADGQSTTLHEERVDVGTERRETGRARLRKYVVTDTEQVEVPVQREELRVEREPVQGESRPGGLSDNASADDLGDQTVTLHEEVPVVHKETVATERVNIGKDTVTDSETVQTQTSHEEVDVQSDGRGNLADGRQDIADGRNDIADNRTDRR